MKHLKQALEALLMVSDQPLTPELAAAVLEVDAAEVVQLCDELSREYATSERGFLLAKVAGGYRYQSHPSQAAFIERYVLEGQSARLSGAALETLAIIAYKQPISRAQVSAIRGVSAEGVVRTLQQRGYIQELGRDDGPGQAVLFGTTSLFLERLGLHSLADLPALGDFVPSAQVVEALEHGLMLEPTEAAKAERLGENGA